MLSVGHGATAKARNTVLSETFFFLSVGFSQAVATKLELHKCIGYFRFCHCVFYLYSCSVKNHSKIYILFFSFAAEFTEQQNKNKPASG